MIILEKFPKTPKNIAQTATNLTPLSVVSYSHSKGTGVEYGV